MSGDEMRNIHRKLFLMLHPEVTQELVERVLEEFPFDEEGAMLLAEFIEKKIDRKIGWA